MLLQSNHKPEYLTPTMTSAQVVETSVTTTLGSTSQDYTHPDDQTTLLQLKTVRKSCLQGNESCVP